jgi:GTP cyclohydrolase FolE2
MPEHDTRVTITLSARAHAEMSLVAEQKGIPLSKHLGQIIEQHHETPSYGNLVKRARCWLRGETYEGNYKGG